MLSSANQITAAAMTRMIPSATDSRNESFITDHGSMRETARRTRRGAPVADTVGMRPVVARGAGAPDARGGAVFVVPVMVCSSVRECVAEPIAAEVAAAAFLSDEVTDSTATWSGDGTSSRSTEAGALGAVGEPDGRTAAGPRAWRGENAAPGAVPSSTGSEPAGRSEASAPLDAPPLDAAGRLPCPDGRLRGGIGGRAGSVLMHPPAGMA